jgi:hypothetical protein
MHTVITRDGFFSIPGLGICKLGDRSFAAMVCREPIHHPSYIAEYSASESTCPPSDGTNAVSPQMTGNAFDFNDSSIGGVISPIVLSYINFEELPRPTGPLRTETHLHLCPGTPIQLATPVELGVSRIELQVSNVNLQDYVHEKSDGGTWGYYSLGFVH